MGEKSTRTGFVKTAGDRRKKSVKNREKTLFNAFVNKVGHTYVRAEGVMGLGWAFGGLVRRPSPPKQEVPVACNLGTGTFVDRSEFSGTAETVPVGRSGNNQCCTSCADRLAIHHHPVTGDGHSGRSKAVPNAAQTQLPAAVPGRVP